MIKNFPFADLAGMSFPGLPFSVWRENRKIFKMRGDVLLHDTGLFRLTVSSIVRAIYGQEMKSALCLPATKRDTFAQEFLSAISSAPRKTIKIILKELGVPERLARLLPALAGFPGGLYRCPSDRGGRTHLIRLLAECPLEVSALGDLSIAMVTRGGIALEEVHAKTMESRLVPGLFFAGEVLDIDGDTGGFNLQAAFSTGFLAAQGIRERAGKHSS